MTPRCCKRVNGINKDIVYSRIVSFMHNWFGSAAARQLSPNCFISIKCSPICHTGCSLNIVFFPKILKYSGLWPFSVLPQCQCVYTHQAGRTQALQQNWQSSEKSQNFKEKTQYLMNNLYISYTHTYINIITQSN